VETSDVVIFYGGAYVVKGRLGLQNNPASLMYEESEPEDDSSIVAYLPISPEDMTLVDPEDRFAISDIERVNLSGLDTSLMLLAEIFLLYRGSAPIDHPHLLIWDHSLSAVMANATPNVWDLTFSGFELGGETLWYPDLLVGYSKPWNSRVGVPTKKLHRLWERAIAELYSSPKKQLDLVEFAKRSNTSIHDVEVQLALLWEMDEFGHKSEGGNPAKALVRKDGRLLMLNREYEHSPEKVVRLFEFFCNKLFRDKDPSILLHEYLDEFGMRRRRFLSVDEISFLMAIGLRLTFENCWRNGVSMIGVVKDSSSSYFSRNYLGVMRKIGKLTFEPRLIPISDRMTLERLPYIDEHLRGPWSTVEFDSTFMTLRLRKSRDAKEATIQGVRGNILVSPNVIMKSLVQFHLKRPNGMMEPSMGHVVFVDRLVKADESLPKVPVVDGDKELGTVEPFFVENASVRNIEQEHMIYLLSVLTRNVFPEVIGYPDPLHYADRGAKAVLHMVEPMLFSSEQLNRSNPMHKTLRQLRGG
jgi:hypothetical protein